MSVPEWPEWKAKLCTAQSQEQMREFADRICSALGYRLFSSPYTMAREAWVAARMASLIGAVSVQMRDRPDCEIVEQSGDRSAIEITEALENGRKRTHEYRGGLPQGVRDDNDIKPDAALLALRKAAESEADRARVDSAYQRSWDLLIYFNVGLFPYDDYLSAFEAGAARETSIAKDLFRRTWVYWETKLYLFWDGAEPRLQRWELR